MRVVLPLASLRYLLRHPWQLALAVVGIALGVAVVVAVDLANAGARRSFELSTELVTGRATHQITGISGGVPNELYRWLRVEQGVRRSAPVVQATVVAESEPGQALTMLGLDPLAEASFRQGLLGQPSWSVDVAPLLTDPDPVVIPASLAHRHALEPGDDWSLLAGPGKYRVRVLAILDDADVARSARGLVLTDIATAQSALESPGTLSRIDLALDPIDDAELIDRLRAALPAGMRLERSAARNQAVAELAAAFQLNLTAMSLLALLVGMFLIYNTMTFSVVQRRDLLGRLRALGVTRGQVFAIVLSEALVLGAAGTGLGLLLGAWLGHWLLELVARTVDDLYYTLTVTEFVLAPMSLVKATSLGLVATLVTAALPAGEAANTPAGSVLQRSDLERRVRRRLPWLAVGGSGTILVGLVLLEVLERGLVVGFGGLFLIILGCALLAPVLLVALARLATVVGGRVLGLTGRMAGRDIPRHLSRTGVAVAALMVALSATVGVGVMVDSFRSSVALWLGQLLNADLYVVPSSIVTGDQSVVLRPEVVRQLRDSPDLTGLSLYRRNDTRVDGEPVQLIAAELAPQARAGYRLAAGDPTDAWRLFQESGAILISEPLAYRHQLSAGDTLTLPAAHGPADLTVAAVFYDYGSEHGRILMRRNLYSQLWDDPAVSSAGLYLDTDDLADTATRIESAAGPFQSVSVSLSRDIRDRSLEVFDRTFKITGVLRLLAVAIAFVGVLSALMAMLLERSREFGVLRAEGMTSTELGQLLALETGFLGLAAGALAIPTGLVLASVLVFGINRRAFGWTMQFNIDPSILVQAVALGLVAALLAGLYPAWRLSRIRPSEALRTD